MITYEELFFTFLNCEKCFPRARKLVLPGTGNLDADIVFVGEAPSVRRTFNLTFGMKSRPVIDAVLQKLKLTRDDIWMTNVVKCIVPGVCTGKPENCKDFLLQELEIIDPKKVVLLGRTAIDAVIGKKVVFGTKIRTLDREILCVPHPMTVVRGTYSLEDYLKFFDSL